MPSIREIRLQDSLFLTLALLLVGLYVTASAGLTGVGFPLDDSWIHQTFARNLARLGQWAFVPGQPTAASTSPLYTVLLALGYGLGASYPTGVFLWTYGLGVLTLAAAGMLGARMARQSVPALRGADWLAGLALVLIWHHIWAAASGMETLLFGVLTLLVMHLAWREQDASAQVQALLLRGALFGFASGLLVLARPEGVLLVGLTGLLLLLTRPQDGRLRSTLVYGLAGGAVFLLTLTPYLALNLSLTGGLLPNTANAKIVQHEILRTLPYGWRYRDLLIAILAGGQALLVPGMLVYAWRYRARCLYLLPLIWALSLIALYAWRLPASYQHGRYVMPALPSLVFAGAVGLRIIWAWGHTRRRAFLIASPLLRRVLARTLALSAVLVLLVFALVNGPRIYSVDVGVINTEMVASAAWIADNLPPEARLAVHDIGAVGYFAPRPILDVAGLVSPEVIPFINDGARLYAWLRERDATHLMGFPDQLPFDNPADPRLCPVFSTESELSPSIGGPNMAIYQLDWDRTCTLAYN